MNNDLTNLRQEIDRIDNEIVDLLGKRFEVVNKVRDLKKKENLDTYHPTREKEILDRVSKKGVKLGLNSLLVQALFLQIFAVSKKVQQKEE